MANVYSVNVRLEYFNPIYVTADTPEQAYDAVTEYLRSEDGRIAMERKMETVGAFHLMSVYRGDGVYPMKAEWPEDMVNIDATKKEDENYEEQA